MTHIPRFTCRECGKDLPEDSDPRRKYCPGTRCRQNFNERLKKEEKGRQVAQARTMRQKQRGAVHQEIRTRALDVIEDEIRDTMREVIREEVTPMIREKAQGAVVVMLDMLPKAMARLAEDLDSKDAIARRSAMAIAFKYAMPTVQENTKQTEDRSHNVYHFIPGPQDTVVGRAMNTELVYDAEENYEAYEADWGICAKCEQRVPPENESYPHGKDREMVCTSCDIRARIERGDTGSDDYLNNPVIR